MKLVVLMKRLPDLVEDLEVDDSGKALDAEFLKFTLNEFDDHALEEALLLKEATGGELTVVAVDGEDVDKMLYTALAKGADTALKISGTGEIGSTSHLARIFTQSLADRSYDLILTGVQAADDRDGQLAPTVAAMIGAPCIEVVTGIEHEAGKLIVRKEYSGGVLAEFDVEPPAVLGIQAARQTPRYAPVSKVRQVQESATLETVTLAADTGKSFDIIRMTPPETGAGAEMLGGVDELVKVMESKGVL
ncbi:MAG: electron transfer flavoprotein subunit beta/FixA family protein [Acidobacteriota bacterium]|nr:electron transfer flavoprotein subunit beta/FixA family protein [Acidobacteriota bacterium]